MYLVELKRCLDHLDLNDVDQLEDIIRTAGRIIIIGNGGSQSTAAHMACDFSKKCNLDVITLDNLPTLTAWANDNSYEDCFSEQVKRIIRIGDVLLCLSASGNSPNIVKAAEMAGKLGATVVSLTGFDGGKLKQISDFNIHININKYDVSEDMHLIIGHILTRMLGEK